MVKPGDTDTGKSFLPRGSQRLTRFHCTGYQSGGPIYSGPRPLLEDKHLTEVGYQQTRGHGRSCEEKKVGRLRISYAEAADD